MSAVVRDAVDEGEGTEGVPLRERAQKNQWDEERTVRKKQIEGGGVGGAQAYIKQKKNGGWLSHSDDNFMSMSVCDR